MKRSLLILIAFALSTGSVFSQYNRCASAEYNANLMKQDPSFKMNIDNLENIIQKKMASDDTWKTTGVVTIPVVFHVLYSSSAQNIPLTRIEAQMDVLNADFSATNNDIINVPSVFQNFVADAQIQFGLAVRDPFGNATDGIIRKQTSTTSFSTW